MTVLGFTGTRNRTTNSQRNWISNEIRYATTLHHGACVGADSDAHDYAMFWYVHIVVHPPTNTKFLDQEAVISSPRVTVLPPKDYLARNRDIVDACDRLIALPDGPERPKSGTWYTIRYAVKTGKPVSICYPAGTVETR